MRVLSASAARNSLRQMASLSLTGGFFLADARDGFGDDFGAERRRGARFGFGAISSGANASSAVDDMPLMFQKSARLTRRRWCDYHSDRVLGAVAGMLRNCHSEECNDEESREQIRRDSSPPRCFGSE
jgi:hypothetical protein